MLRVRIFVLMVAMMQDIYELSVLYRMLLNARETLSYISVSFSVLDISVSIEDNTLAVDILSDMYW